MSTHITDALEVSADSTGFTLKVYYTASFLPSKIYADEFHAAGNDTERLGDRFSKELTLSGVTDKERLQEVAALYEKATGLKAN